ncbi:response regulator [Actinokineospora iranica]|uniref:DNA-binding response regulator, NarL/FixJ family, contains REC and HTH domains n=1 Tax=Actinokineospora iranica TaxID=1271860 RepID=A0A1G6JNI5_9PSEU|nr:response regulator transcription factor [Actinokineospora iranica]SDC20257.1 DNA-binding response regulator, NarL/FixJ family, contains REC and HTH domains [Actinokineospora iranica]
MTIRVLLADDHAMYRSGVRALVDAQPGLECVAEAADGEAAVAEAVRSAPDLAVLDIRMPRLDGIAATEAIRAALGERTRVLVLTTHDLDEYVHLALCAGASGFLLKSVSPEELAAGMRVVARGDALIDPSVTRRLISRFAAGIKSTPAPPVELGQLTARERQVLLLVAEALSNVEIADRLFIGEETVKTHVSRILAKLGLRDRVHAVVYAYRAGLMTESNRT